MPPTAAAHRSLRSTTPGSSTMRAGSGSSRTPAAGTCDRVLPLALGGLAALGHRGAFGADGESSDGAGVALPLEAAGPRRRSRPGAGGSPPGRRRPVPAPRPRAGGAGPRARRGGASRARGSASPTLAARAHGPGRARRRGRRDPAGRRPGNRRPPGRSASGRPISDADFERRLVIARRRLETAARAARLDDLSVPSASCRTIVYKGLVAGGRLAELYPDLARPIRVSYALFHQRYATNTQPTWRARPAVPLDRPQRRDRHGPRQSRAGPRQGRRRDRRRGAARARPGLRRGSSSTRARSSRRKAPTRSRSTRCWSCSSRRAGTWDRRCSRRCRRRRRSAARLTPTSRRCGAAPPGCSPRGTVRPRSSSRDGRRVGAIMDRNGLRPAAFAVTRDRLVAVASEAGAIPLAPSDTVRRGRLGPGEMLLVDPRRRAVLEDADAKAHLLRRLPIHDAPRPAHVDATPTAGERTPSSLRYLAGLDSEKARLDIKTMVLEAHEPLWSMGDDTPTPGLGRVDRPVADHLRQSFAQVTNPPIDPERERAVMDMRVDLGRRPALLGGPPRATRRARTLRLDRPVVADLDGAARRVPGPRSAGSTRPGTRPAGPGGLEAALERLADAAVRAARGRTELLVLVRSRVLGRRACRSRRSSPSAPSTRRSPTRAFVAESDILVDAADILDVHSLAMALAAGATAAVPWLAVELAIETAGSRGAEELTADDAVANLLAAFEAGLRKTLARMGISTIASYIGGLLFETLELDADLLRRCFPGAPAWRGTVGLRRDRGARDPAGRRRGLDRRRRPVEPAAGPGIRPVQGRRRGAPLLPEDRGRDHGPGRRARPGATSTPPSPATATPSPRRLRRGRPRRPPNSPRSASVAPVPLADVEPARDIVRRFVVSAMSVGALSPEAHQALTIGIQRAGGAANTGEGGEDPAWYTPTASGERHDAKIKQVASARFGVTAAYLARADQLEIKIAQGSKPGEGGQLPARKATAYIATLRRGQPGMTYISPPPHHDIYSIEDLAQLIADLRAINPAARVGVKLVASRGVGTIAAGVVKAGANYVQLSGHAGGTGASPLSSIKHVGAPWELGLAEVHQTLLRNGLRDRVALRTDGGLRTGRDLLVAALLGAEEFAFGTSMLVALGCDMARQCHLDTCPTGIATQREDLRAKFTGTPEQVERFAEALAEDLRRELAAVGARVGRRGRRGGEPAARAGARTTRRERSIWRRSSGAPRWDGGGRPPLEPGRGRSRRPPPARVAARGPPRRRARRPGRLLGRRAQALDGRSVVRRRPVGRVRARPAPRADPARAPRRGRPVVRGFRRARARPAARRPGQRLRRQGPVGRAARRRAGGRSRGRREPPGDRRQHLPLRRDRRATPSRRPGRDAVRGPEFRRAGRRRGSRPARLRVHDRRRRRRPGPDRGELRGGDDGRSRLLARSRRAPCRGAGFAERHGLAAFDRGARPRGRHGPRRRVPRPRRGPPRRRLRAGSSPPGRAPRARVGHLARRADRDRGRAADGVGQRSVPWQPRRPLQFVAQPRSDAAPRSGASWPDGSRPRIDRGRRSELHRLVPEARRAQSRTARRASLAGSSPLRPACRSACSMAASWPPRRRRRNCPPRSTGSISATCRIAFGSTRNSPTRSRGLRGSAAWSRISG